MAETARRGPETLIEKTKEAIERLAEALDRVLAGPRPAPAYVPVRQPSAESLRRRRRSR